MICAFNQSIVTVNFLNDLITLTIVLQFHNDLLRKSIKNSQK